MGVDSLQKDKQGGGEGKQKRVQYVRGVEEGVIYFYDRVDSKTKIKSLAYAYVKKQKVENC